MTTKINYIYALGRRKTSSARVRLFKGSGDNMVNGKKTTDLVLVRPLKIVDVEQKLHFTAKVSGGGVEGQKEAVVHGLSRALVKYDEKFKEQLKRAGLLTRDSRERQRRMVGTGGKARRKKQSPKR